MSLATGITLGVAAVNAATALITAWVALRRWQRSDRFRREHQHQHRHSGRESNGTHA